MAELLDCRRLTGPNLLWDRPSVVIDIACPHDQASALQAAWQDEVLALHRALGWSIPNFCTKARIGGLSLAFDGPIDRLYAGMALAEAAWERCDAGGDVVEDAITERAAEEANPALLLLQTSAERHRAPFLWDDDEVSVGHGPSVRVWPAR